MSHLHLAELSDSQLFRLLLTVPYPVAGIEYRLRGAENVALSVKALRASEFAQAFDVPKSVASEDAKRGLVSCRLLTAALLADGAQAFASPEEVGQLMNHLEVVSLTTEVLAALDAISPTYTRAPENIHERLRRGAKDCVSETMALGGCYDIGGERFIERPDRYFGMPLNQMLDGHWMAYRAARSVFEELKSK